MKNIVAKKWFLPVIILVVIIGAAIGIWYGVTSSNQIATDKAEIGAPVITLSPLTPGILQNLYVNQGDTVNAYTVVAQVGNELLKTQSPGLVTYVNNGIGATVNPGTAVVTLINPADLRVVAHIDENKGLKDIKVGQRVEFTVDAYGGKKYEGVVDEISSTARSGDVVFNISDKRQTQVFDVKIRFDTSTYSEIQNGMSAKVVIFKK